MKGKNSDVKGASFANLRPVDPGFSRKKQGCKVTFLVLRPAWVQGRKVNQAVPQEMFYWIDLCRKIY